MDLRAVADSGLEHDLAEIQDAFDIWARDGLLVVPACLRDQLGRVATLTPTVWMAAMCGHRDRIGWEQLRRRAACAAAPG